MQQHVGNSTKDAFNNPVEAGYQIEQTLAALGRGGIWGVGPGNSTQKFIPLPAAHTDGAFAIIAEEFGLVGSLVVMAVLGLLIWRGLVAASRARDGYGALLAIGITCWLGYQALLNIAVITAVIPFTGIPLPFISYGGSAFRRLNCRRRYIAKHITGCELGRSARNRRQRESQQ